jgi:glycosyltransferase 2 family protein
MGWVLNGAALHRIWGDIQHMHWAWVSGAVVADVCVYLFHAWRWKLLLRPIGRVPFIQAVESIYVGLFANEVLPLRAGELVRCFLLSKFTDIPLSVTFASALIERIFDGIWLLTCFLFCLRLGKLPGVLLHGGYILAVLIVVCTLVLAYAMYARKQSLDLVFGISWPRWFDTLIEDLHLIGHSRYLYFSFFVSGLYLFAQICPIYMLVQANRLAVPWTASFTMMVLLRLSSIVPQAPGNLGSFQWVAARTLIMFGLASAHAKRFSLILWAVVTVPLIVIGFVAIALEGINMTHLHKQASEAAKARK